MVKISALPPMTSPDGADPAPVTDTSAGATLKLTLTKLKEWLQSLTSWITTAMVADAAITKAKIDYSTGAGWEELGRTTLGAANDRITVQYLPARKYLQVLIFTTPTGGTNRQLLTLNNDNGNNYALSTIDGVTLSTSTSASSINTLSVMDAPALTILDIINVVNQEKEVTVRGTARNAAGAASAPVIKFVGGKWVNTTDLINRIDIVNNGAGDFNTGSEVVVLGRNQGEFMNKTPAEYLQEIQELIGVSPPMTLTTNLLGQLIKAEYETEWKEGHTTPKDTGKKYANGEPVFEYEEHYKEHKLTPAQVTKLEKYITDNVTSQHGRRATPKTEVEPNRVGCGA